jgi:hypothetical protein
MQRACSIIHSNRCATFRQALCTCPTPEILFSTFGTAFGIADFAGWASVLAADAVECYYVELPGRGLRQSEPAISDAGKLVDALITELLTHMVRACMRTRWLVLLQCCLSLTRRVS